MESQQVSAVFGAFAFLGTLAAVCASIAVLTVVKLAGEERLSNIFTLGAKWIFGGWGLARKLMVAILLLLFVYSATLLGSSLASQEWTVAPGGEKYFCEIDCHLAYSVISVETAESLGPSTSVVKAQGTFVIVSVRTRFDEKTISRHRGDSPIVPSERELSLVDDTGRNYWISESGQIAMEMMGKAGPPMNEALRPGDSHISKLVFDLPADAHSPRLMVRRMVYPRWVSTLIIGDEDSFLHKRVYLALATASARQVIR